MLGRSLSRGVEATWSNRTIERQFVIIDGMALKIKEKLSAEHAASAIVSAVTSCTTRRLDPGGGALQLADYVLVSADGNDIGLLEVTSVTHERSEAFEAASTKVDDRPKVLGRQRSDDAGRAGARPTGRDAGVGVLKATTSNLLAPNRASIAETSNHCRPRSLTGVVEVRALPKRGGQVGGVCVNIMPWGGTYGIGSLTAAVEGVASRNDNRNKLCGDLNRRELFIWVNPPSALSALTTFCDEPFAAQVASARPPNFPNEVTAVWAAAWPRENENTRALALWLGNRSGWTVLDQQLRQASVGT